MKEDILSNVIIIVFVVTALLTLVNLLKRINELPILQYLEIRDTHLNKLFQLLIIEVVVLLLPIAVNAINNPNKDYQYEDTYIITSGGKTNIRYHKPFKYIPNVKITNTPNTSHTFKISDNQKEFFIVDTSSMVSDFKITYKVRGVLEY